MTIIVDTSAILSVLLKEEHRLFILESTLGNDLCAPTSIDAEIANALSAMFKRRRIDLPQALSVLSQFEVIPIRRMKIRMEETIEIAHRYAIYAYDAFVLDCSVQFDYPILSIDTQLIRIAKEMNLSVLEP